MTANPWLPLDEPGPDVTSQLVGQDLDEGWLGEGMPVLTGAAAPQPGSVPTPAGVVRLALFAAASDRLWVTGVHGGAGESTVAGLLGGSLGASLTAPLDAAGAHQAWPDGSPGAAALLLVARTHAAGLRRLQEVATCWAAGDLPAVRLLGAVLVPDAPGRLPAPLSHLARLVAGGVPHLWWLDWHEELRFGDQPSTMSRQWRRSHREITRALGATQTATSRTASRQPTRETDHDA